LAFPAVLVAMVVAWFGLSAMAGGGTGTPATGGAADAPLDATQEQAVSAFAAVPAREPDCSAGTVRLTFDDGPNRQITPAVLDLLEQWQATATFFVIGRWAQAEPDLVRRAVEEGHTIGNHTWSHPDLTELAPDGVREELARTSEVIATTTGSAPQVWRPPFGNHDAAVDAEAEALGLDTVMWDHGTDGLDWKGVTPEQITQRVVGNARPGSIVLLHDIHQNTLDALPLVLEGLHEKGLCAR
jgi:peptidoglycan/xylan/chitin deacetylase (PgdA/CDA1 family)